MAAEKKALKTSSKKDKVERLEHLLSKSIAYSEFLADKIKKEGEGAIAVQDGSVKGPGLPQPKLVTGGEMRPYQLVRPVTAAASRCLPLHPFLARRARSACTGWWASTRTGSTGSSATRWGWARRCSRSRWSRT